MRLRKHTYCWLGLIASVVSVYSASDPFPATAADHRLEEYFRAQVQEIETSCLADIRVAGDWIAKRPLLRKQAAEMLGLDPMPVRSDLKAVVTGRQEYDFGSVENIQFQSLPGLYVTANLYLPKALPKSGQIVVSGGARDAGTVIYEVRPVPAILYLCGHGPVITNGISYGNKVSYQHHGIWFARNGYACLIIDTVQYGEIQGIHHGTHRYGMWWWNSCGYSPAGVEAWNGIRALDYLCTRPEVDASRLGVTGRSGGGSYSWTVAALDERIKAAAPVAGITDLRNHVLDGAVEGHCDCMFIVNSHRWDYPQLAALIAPRPLLLVNTDSDTIFPLDGVVRTHSYLRRLYTLFKVPDQLGLVIGPGPHKDTQDIQVPVMRWFNRFLKKEESNIENAAVKLLAPEQLRVFRTYPNDSKNTNIHAYFIPSAKTPAIPQNLEEWKKQSASWLLELNSRTFAGWPSQPDALFVKLIASVTSGDRQCETYEFTSQKYVPLRFYALHSKGKKRPGKVMLHIGDANAGNADPQRAETVDVDSLLSLHPHFKTAMAGNTTLIYFEPRGLASDRWSGDAKKHVQLRRRFMLLGQTLDSMRVWDIRRALQAVNSLEFYRDIPLQLESHGAMGVNALYAALYKKNIHSLELSGLPSSHMDGPDYLNVLQTLDIPQALAMVIQNCPVRLKNVKQADWQYPLAIAEKQREHPSGNPRLTVEEHK